MSRKPKKQPKPVSDLPVMKSHCATCPFKPDKNGRWQDVDLANAVCERTLFKAQQLCHVNGYDPKKPQFRCKGPYEHNKTIYDRLGWGDLLK